MTRDETTQLFERCEAARREAKAKALAHGQSERDAREIAHEAAKAVWNGSAEGMLTERKALEQSGHWIVEKTRWRDLEAKERRNPQLAFPGCGHLLPVRLFGRGR